MSAHLSLKARCKITPGEEACRVDEASARLNSIRFRRMKAYREALDASLLEFESSKEWADLITALQKVSCKACF